MAKTLSIIFSGWLVTFFLTIISLQGCIQDDCGPFPIFELDSIESNVFHIEADSQSYGYNLVQIDTTSRYSYIEIGIKIEFQLQRIAYWDFNLSSVQACSPPEYYAEVKSLKIMSDTQYNEYEAGDDLTELFKIQVNYYRSSTEIPEYLANNGGWMSGFDFYLLKAIQEPTIEGTHQFTVQIELIDGTFLETTTEKVSITQ